MVQEDYAVSNKPKEVIVETDYQSSICFHSF